VWLAHLWSYAPKPEPKTAVRLEYEYQKIATATSQRCEKRAGTSPSGALMIGEWAALAGALVLLLVLLAWVRAEASSKDSRSDWGASDQEQARAWRPVRRRLFRSSFPQPTQNSFRTRIARLGDLFRRERTAVAFHWVQETSAFISKVMLGIWKRAA